MDDDDDNISEAVRQMEALMLDRGYVRDARGFWILPGAEIRTGAQHHEDNDQ